MTTQFNSLLVKVRLSLALLLVWVTVAFGQSTPQNLRLSKIEFTGLQRYDQAQVIALSGLQIGQVITADVLDAAAKQLLKTGLFKRVLYSSRCQGEEATVSFEVIEMQWTVRCIFDNFVWLNDREIIEAVRREVPFFDGTAPESETVIEKIKSVLERVLQEREVPGRIDYFYAAGSKEVAFRVKGVSLLVCAVTFPGAAGVEENLLRTTVKPIINGEYSKQYVTQFAENNLMPLYRQRGYLRARLLAPQARLESEANKGCKNRVTVTLPVEEGVAYSLGQLVWAGNQVLSVSTLEGLFGLKTGAVADGLKIEAGMGPSRGLMPGKGTLKPS